MVIAKINPIVDIFLMEYSVSFYLMKYNVGLWHFLDGPLEWNHFRKNSLRSRKQFQARYPLCPHHCLALMVLRPEFQRYLFCTLWVCEYETMPHNIQHLLH